MPGENPNQFAIVATIHAARLRNGKLRREPFLTPLLWSRVLATGDAECEALKEAYSGERGIGALKVADMSTHHQPVPAGFFHADRVFTHPPTANGRPISSKTAWALLMVAKQIRELSEDFEEVTTFVGGMPDA